MTPQKEDASRPDDGGLFTSGRAAARRWRVVTHQPVSYEVRFSTGLLDPENRAIADAAAPASPARPRRLVVVDCRVRRLYGERIDAYLTAHGIEYDQCVLAADEQAKTMESVFTVVSAMDRFGIARRNEPVIAIGGGVLTDVVGLATSLYRRSTPYVRVPTTLIGMVDAGIGAKTGVNFQQHKNRLGSYHPSAVTLVDPVFLCTLDTRQLSNGFAEILKIGLVKDAELFALTANHGRRLIDERMQSAGSADGGGAAGEVLRRAIHGMLHELQPNLWEHHLQRLVDYGHSFSPTIEMAALPQLLHGEAVCVDMAFTTVLARRRGLVSPGQLDRVMAAMTDLDLPTWHPVCTPELIGRALAETVAHRDGRQRLPLPVGIGAARFVDDLTTAELDAALRDLESRHRGTASARPPDCAAASLGGHRG
jgi:3-dehydroquinate synthase